ncbi:unnamed protein product [Caretta caretta]
MLHSFSFVAPLVIKLACTDMYMMKLLLVSSSGLVATGAFIALFISCTIILVQIRAHVMQGKHKALATCATQIKVLRLHFGPWIFIYDWPFQKFMMDKPVSVLHSDHSNAEPEDQHPEKH